MTYRTLLDYTLSVQPVVIKCLKNLAYRHVNLAKPSVYTKLIIDPGYPKINFQFSNDFQKISLNTDYSEITFHEELKGMPERDLYLSYLFNIPESQRLIRWLIVRSAGDVCQQTLKEFFPDLTFKHGTHDKLFDKDSVSLTFEGKKV